MLALPFNGTFRAHPQFPIRRKKGTAGMLPALAGMLPANIARTFAEL
jgi:hypothetical protein